MLGITDLPTYLIGTLAIILVPGPNSMYCLSVAAQHGTKTAYRAVAASLLGDSILMLATALGAGVFLKAVPELFHAVKLVGGLYLAYIGFNLLRAALKKWREGQPPVGETVETIAPTHVFKRALLLSLTNPKAILFLLSFFVQFVDPAYAHPMLTFFMLALILQAISLTYLSVLVFSGSRLAAAFRRQRKVSSVSMGAVGSLFMGFALKLWRAEL